MDLLEPSWADEPADWSLVERAVMRVNEKRKRRLNDREATRELVVSHEGEKENKIVEIINSRLGSGKNCEGVEGFD